MEILIFFDEVIKYNKKSKITVLNDLVRNIKRTGIGKIYSREILKAFKLDAKKKRYRNWNELLDYCKFSANPVGRFFIEIIYYKEKLNFSNKSEILKASDTLCTSLQIINHIQDCKEDFSGLDRVYIPESLFNKYKIPIETLKKNISCTNFIKLKNEMVSNVEDMLIDLSKSLKKIKPWSLKKETLIILNIAKRLCFLLKRYDPLKKKIKLSRIELIFCFIKGIMYD